MMFKNLFLKTIWERRASILAWCIGILVMTMLVAMIYPSFAANNSYQQLAESLPDSFSAIFGEISQLSTPEGYLGVELYSSLSLPLLLVILAIGFGSGTIGKEDEDRTLELLLAKPISRIKIISQKYAVMLLVIMVASLASLLGIQISELLVDISVNSWNVLSVSFHAGLIGLAFGSFGLALNNSLFRRGASIAISAAVFVYQILATTLADLTSSLAFMHKTTIFSWYDPQAVLANGPNYWHMLFISLISLGLFLMATISFNRRDMR